MMQRQELVITQRGGGRKKDTKKHGVGGVSLRKTKQSRDDIETTISVGITSGHHPLHYSPQNQTYRDNQLPRDNNNDSRNMVIDEKSKPRRLPLSQINWKIYMRSGNPAILFWIAITMLVLVLFGTNNPSITTKTGPSGFVYDESSLQLQLTPSRTTHSLTTMRNRIPHKNKGADSLRLVKLPTSIIFTNARRQEVDDDGDNNRFFRKDLSYLDIKDENGNYRPDFGNLLFTIRPDLKAPIPISFVDDYKKYEEQRTNFLTYIEGTVNDKYSPISDRENLEQRCRLTAWSSYTFPNCNQMHELTTERPYNYSQHPAGSGDGHNSQQDFEVFYLNSGTYRDAWRLKRLDDIVDDHVVLKRMIFNKKSDAKDMYKIQKEARIQERLSHSPRILDIYGFCGTSVHVQAMAGDFWKTIVPSKTGIIGQEVLDQLPNDKIRQNNLTTSEILQVSLDMALSLADLHNYEGGPITHADTHIEQWLIGTDDSIHLNDFNNAKEPEWDDSAQKYCETHGGYGGLYRSPEEFVPTAQDVSRDVFAYGNNIYTMLTGLWPFYDDESRGRSGSDIRKEIVGGRRPYVDPYFRSNACYIERSLVDVMEKCWKGNRTERPPIYEVVDFLRVVKQNAIKHGELKPSNLIHIPLE